MDDVMMSGNIRNDTTGCVSLSMEINHMDTKIVAQMAASVFLKLQWSLTVIFYDFHTAHIFDKFSDYINIQGYQNIAYNIDGLEGIKLRQIIDDVYGRLVEQRINVTIICSLSKTQSILKEANSYDLLPENHRRKSLRDHSSWFILTKSCNQTRDISYYSSELDNVVVLNLQPALLLIEKYSCDKQRTNMKKCKHYCIYTLMWKRETGFSKTPSPLRRKFEEVGFVDISGRTYIHSDLQPNVKFGFNGRNLLVTTSRTLTARRYVQLSDHSRNLYFCSSNALKNIEYFSQYNEIIMQSYTSWGKKYPPFTEVVEHNGTTVYSGFCIELIAELSKRLNFTYNMTSSTEFGMMLENGSWIGMVGQLVRREVDVISAALTIRPERETVMDFTLPFYYDSSTLLMKKVNPNENKLYTYTRPLRLEVILFIGLALFVSALLLCVIERITPHYKIQGEEGKQDFQMSFWYMFGALISQGGESLPNSQSGRTVVSAFWLFAIVMVATYCGNLIAFLTVPLDKPPFDSLEELVERSDYKWGFTGGSFYVTWFKNSSDEPLKRFWKGVIKFNSTDPDVLNPDTRIHFEKLSKEKYAMFGDKSLMDEMEANRCELRTAKQEFPNNFYGIGLPNNSLHTKAFSDQITKLHENGLLHALKRRYMPLYSNCSTSSVAKPTTVKIIDIHSAFYLLTFGTVISTLVLLTERLSTKFTSFGNVLRPQSDKNSISIIPVQVMNSAEETITYLNEINKNDLSKGKSSETGGHFQKESMQGINHMESALLY